MPASEKQKKQALVNTVQLVQKHLVEGKTMVKCAEEIGVSRNALQNYKKKDDYRQMALALLDDSTLGGVDGVVKQLVVGLEAEKPIILESVDKDGASHQGIEYVADNVARDKALGKIIDVYGLKAPAKQDITVEVSLSSDEDLFKQIDDAQESRRYVESYIEGEGGFELAKNESTASDGSFEQRGRTLLQDDAVPEP
jgi:hypothetical protein